MPSPMPARAASRSASAPARRSSSSCSFRAVSGERSSCAASATNARCASSDWRSRSSSALSECASGASSSGRPPVGERRQRLGIAGAQLAGEAGERRQVLRRQPPDHERGERRHQEQRQDAAPGGVRRQALADLDRLGDLDHALAGGDAVGAPGAALDLQRRQAEQRPRRQRRMRPRGVDAAAVDGPDLDHEVELRIGDAVGLRRRDLALVAQRQRHLLQLVVEDRLGLGEDVAIGDRAHQQRRQREQAEQRRQQAGADRGHAAGSTK